MSYLTLKRTLQDIYLAVNRKVTVQLDHDGTSFVITLSESFEPGVPVIFHKSYDLIDMQAVNKAMTTLIYSAPY